MPKRFDLTEGDVIRIRGVPITVALARGKRAVVGVGIEDADGLLEESVALKRWGARMREKIDSPDAGTKDY